MRVEAEASMVDGLTSENDVYEAKKRNDM